jgi:N-acetylneuraminate synthase
MRQDMPVVTVSRHDIGPGHPCFIIAEAGVNHDGDIGQALRLVEAAAASGADAVKFQTFCTEALVTRDAPKAEYQRRTTGTTEGQFEMLKRLELSEASHVRIMQHCDACRITFLSTPYDEASVDLLDRLGVPAFKVASTDTTNLPMLEYIGAKSRPVILSTGMCSIEEVGEAVAAVRATGNDSLVLLQCTSQYPAPEDEINLGAIRSLEAAFRCPTGYSDHAEGVAASLWAVAAGACVIEKHFTLDRSLAGPDHAMSIDAGELARLVSGIRAVEKALGDGVKRVMPCEAGNKKTHQKSLVVRRPIASGEVITSGHLACKRPGNGLAPRFYAQVVGRRAARDLAADELIDWSALRPD